MSLAKMKISHCCRYIFILADVRCNFLWYLIPVWWQKVTIVLKNAFHMFWRNGGRQVGLCTESCMPGAQLANQQSTVIKGDWILNQNVMIVSDTYRVAFTQCYTAMLALVTFGCSEFMSETIGIKNESPIIWPKRVALAGSSSGCFSLICGIALCKE